MESSTRSMVALATSPPFVEALRRDVHILVDAFALAWMWLGSDAAGAPVPTASLRWEYGSLAVFERVWTRNHWHQVDCVLGSHAATRLAFSDAVVAACLDELSAVADVHAEGTTLLHGVAAVFALYFWAKSLRLPPYGFAVDRGTWRR